MLDSGLDESGSLISPFEDMLGYNDKNEEDWCNGKKRGLDDLYSKLLRLHLHYPCVHQLAAPKSIEDGSLRK
jgi:hypothetical protein